LNLNNISETKRDGFELQTNQKSKSRKSISLSPSEHNTRAALFPNSKNTTRHINPIHANDVWNVEQRLEYHSRLLELLTSILAAKTSQVRGEPGSLKSSRAERAGGWPSLLALSRLRLCRSEKVVRL